MSSMQFSEQEKAFFDEGDTLTEECAPVEDFSDLDQDTNRGSSWVERAMAVLSLVAPARSA